MTHAIKSIDDVRALLMSVVLRYEKKYPKIGRADMIACAEDTYLSCVDSYDGGRSSFNNWLYLKVEKGLQSLVRRHYDREAKRRTHYELSLRRRRSRFCLRDLFEAISADARHVVRMMIDPTEIDVDVNESNAGAIRNAVVETLVDIGWSVGRIKESFAEIKQALSEQ